MFHWYVQFAGEGKHFHTDEAVRAVEFAIDFSRAPVGYDVRGEAAKAVSYKLRRARRWLYWEAPSMPEFLRELLGAIREDRGGYSAASWHLTERAIRRIVAAEDVTFYSHLVELHRLHRDGTIQPSEFCQREDPFVRVRNDALLAEATHLLAAAQEAQTPDLGVRVGSLLRKKAGLEGSVVVEVDYPIPGDHPTPTANESVAVRVLVGVTRDGEQKKLSSALGEFSVELQSEGRIEVKHMEGESAMEWRVIGEGWGAIRRGFSETFVAEFLVRSKAGRRRLWLSIRDGKTELAARAIYLEFK